MMLPAVAADATLAECLCCPYCRDHFTPRYAPRPEPWIMSCHCGRFPVIEGIPILKKDPTTSELIVDLIDRGRPFDAFVAAMMPPSGGPPAWQPRPYVPSLLRRVVNHWTASKWAMQGRRWQERARAFLATCADRTAFEMFDFYFRQPPSSRPTTFDYFAFRFGQPRHLVALSFATLIHPQTPLLEIGCGCGHITRTLSELAHPQPAVGIDRSFFAAYVAHTLIAPKARFLCMDAELGLPFPDGVFQATLCVDGWQYYTAKLGLLREMRRVVREEGAVMMIACRNRLHSPTDGQPLSPEGYQTIVGSLPHRIVADDAVLDRYITKEGPALAVSSGIESLRASAMCSVIVSENVALWRDHGEFRDWPHARGPLGLNPLYQADRDASGGVRLHRVFPSAFYEHQNGDCKRYLPEVLTVDASVLARVNDRTPDVERLIQRCVVLGLPHRYC